MTHVLPTGTQKGSMLHRVLMTLVYGAVDSLASCSPCVVIHCVLMTSVCVAVDSLQPMCCGTLCVNDLSLCCGGFIAAHVLWYTVC